jgi:hypothetical protein
MAVASVGSTTCNWPDGLQRTDKGTLWSDGSICLLVSCPVDFGVLAKTFVKAMA